MIFEQIRNQLDDLSKTQKIIAQFILEDYSSFAFMHLEQISEQLDVSAASIYRFCKRLGYDGFPALQREIQSLVRQEFTPMKELKASIQDESIEEDIFQNTITSNIEMLNNLYTEQMNSKFLTTVSYLAQARTIYIIGLRSSFSVAYYSYFMLNQLRDSIILLEPGRGDLYDSVNDMTPDDILLAISFSPYTSITVEVLKVANQKGLNTIGITDSNSSPLAMYAKLPIVIKKSSRMYSFVPVSTFLNAVIISLGKTDKDRILHRLKKKQEYLKEHGVYYQKEPGV
ncbi:MAG: MurR/RpiR family transcriptional regulator [Halanaerobium sp.]|nr:MurR/RpiR family transcriptional regulator [Halanaerobium sp.]